MADQFLSQDEVDALLENVTGESQTLEHPEEEKGGTRDYDIASQERIIRGRMPTMEIINERFARNLRIGLFNLLRKTPEISVGSVRVVKYSAFLRDIVVPTNINIISAQPLRGSGLVIFDPNLVFCVIDSLFGGSGKYHLRIEGRDFSPTEQRIIQRMLEVVLGEYAKAWGTLCRFNFAYQRSEMHTQFANIATPTEIVVLTTFSIDFGNGGGAIHVCIPYATLEPVRDIIYSAMQGDQTGPDRRWVRMLAKQVQAAEVELSATLAHAEITVRKLLECKVGDVIPVEIPPVLQATVDGVPIFDCTYGVSNGAYAVKIENVLTISQAHWLGEKSG